MIALNSAFGEHADFLEHRGVRHGAEDVLSPQPPIEGNGFGELRDIRAPGRWRNVRCEKLEKIFSCR